MAPKDVLLPTEEPAGHAPTHWSFGTTADVGIAARAADGAGLLSQLAEALVEVITDRDGIAPREHRPFRVEANTLEGLVVAFLGEILYWQDSAGWLPHHLEVRLGLGRTPVAWGTAFGEALDPARHPVKVGVKAITLHHLTFDHEAGRASVILDI
jgi:SHS2 domain-containing protein